MLGLVLPHPATWPGAGLSHTGQVRHPQPQGNPRGARHGVRAAAGVRQKTSPATTAGTRWQHQAGSPTPGTVGGTGATLALCFFLVWGFVFPPQSPMLVPWAFLAACREGGHVPVGMALRGGRGGPAGRELHSQEGHCCHW